MTRSPVVAWLRDLTPPVLWRGLRSALGDRMRLQGPHASWAEARAHATGYDDPEILARVREAALRVKRGEAAYERDTVAFADPRVPPEVAAGLLLAAGLDRGRLRVLDYGGALGGLHGQCRPLLEALPDVGWRILEQPHYVAAGRREFETPSLRFFADLGECTADWAPNAIVLSSVLQYLEHPHAVGRQLAALGAAVVIVDRTPFTVSGPDVIAVQQVPAALHRASYPSWVLEESRLRGAFPGYERLMAFDSPEGVVRTGKIAARYGGMILWRRSSLAVPGTA